MYKLTCIKVINKKMQYGHIHLINFILNFRFVDPLEVEGKAF